LGASIGLVKCGDTTQIVSGSSLPLGVLDEMSPAITKKALGQGDIVVLLSDGIVDCFNDTNRVAEVFVEYCNATPQSIAQAMLAKAMKNSKNKPTDDMTVVVAKLV
jgi:stage II sporulation protein E